MSAISLKSVLAPAREIEVEFPGYEGFKLKIAFLSREEVAKIRKKCTVSKFDRDLRRPMEQLDGDLFVDTYVPAVLKGWTGLKYSYLQELILVDIPAEVSLDDTLEYTAENAVVLMKNSSEVDNFVTDVTSSLANFMKYSSLK